MALWRGSHHLSGQIIAKICRYAGGTDTWQVDCCESLALGACVAMADLVRQVEVHCASRGRALALVWNLHTAALTASISDTPPPSSSFTHPPPPSSPPPTGAPLKHVCRCRLRPACGMCKPDVEFTQATRELQKVFGGFQVSTLCQQLSPQLSPLCQSPPP